MPRALGGRPVAAGTGPAEAADEGPRIAVGAARYCAGGAKAEEVTGEIQVAVRRKRIGQSLATVRED